jgi:hypothetical protein
MTASDLTAQTPVWRQPQRHDRMHEEAALANDLAQRGLGDALGPTARIRRLDRLVGALGIVFVALQLGVGAVLGGAPALDAPGAEIQSYLVDEGGNVLLAATMGALSAFFFILFLGTMRTFLASAEGSPETLSTVAFGAGLVTITLATTAGLPAVALAWNDTAAIADPGLVQAAWNLNTLALVPIGGSAGAFCLAAALIILRTRVMPAWVGWIGVLAAVAGVIATFFLVADDADSPLGTPANLGGYLLAMLFILLLSTFMTTRLGRSEADRPQRA